MNISQRIGARFPQLGILDPDRGKHVDMDVRVGTVDLQSPLMPASGTAGHGAELSAYVDLSELGAVVVKSLSSEPWAGNPAPRVHQVTAGMINSVGLQGPGVQAWADDELPELLDHNAAVVVSIWGRTIDEYHRAAELVRDLPPEVVAVEVNLSCPNLDGGAHLFAHDAKASEAVIAGCLVANRPLWAKLSPNTDRVRDVAESVMAAGSDALTLTNTMLGMAVDIENRSYRLGSGQGGGGVSGPAIHAIIMRIVHDLHKAMPEAPIIAAGGVATVADIVEFMLVGASAVQVGTATFADPAILGQLNQELRNWCYDHDVGRVSELTSALSS